MRDGKFMKRWLATVLLVGCSYTFDSGAPQLPLVGAVPDTASLPHLNTMPVYGEVFAQGFDQRIWLVLQQSDLSWRMLPMSGEPAVETITPAEADDVFVTWGALYIIKRQESSGIGGFVDGGVPMQPPAGDMGVPPAPPLQLTVRSIGEQPGHVFSMPDGQPVIYSFGADDVFVYLVTDATLPGYIIQRRDESFKRIVPWPKGTDPVNPWKNGVFFPDSGAGDWFYDRDVDGRVVGHSARSNDDIDLGIRPRFFAWVDSRTLITCGSDGVRVVPADGVTAERVLDNAPCKQERLYLNNGYVYYDVGTTMFKTKLDGTAPPQPVFAFGSNRILYITQADEIAYSTDPADRYSHSAGDGWLGNWRFMDRGIAVEVSRDRQHLYWLEHAAQNGGVGDFTTVKLSAPGVPGGTPVALTRNTRQFGFLADGRILADENHAFADTSNRIVIIDELHQRKQWVATSASRFSQIPQSGDYIIDVVSGATGHDVVRVQLPPPDPPPPPNR